LLLLLLLVIWGGHCKCSSWSAWPFCLKQQPSAAAAAAAEGHPSPAAATEQAYASQGKH
jgi:hypothetical protein